MKKTLIILEGVSQEELRRFYKLFNSEVNPIIMANDNLKILSLDNGNVEQIYPGRTERIKLGDIEIETREVPKHLRDEVQTIKPIEIDSKLLSKSQRKEIENLELPIPVIIEPKIKRMAETPIGKRFRRTKKEMIADRGYRPEMDPKIKDMTRKENKKVAKKKLGGPSKYPAAMENFVRKNVNSYSNKELCGVVNEKWDLKINVPQLANYMFMRGLKRSSKKKDNPKRKPRTRKYGPEVIQFLKENVNNFKNRQLAEMIEEKFNIKTNHNAVNQTIKRYKITRDEKQDLKPEIIAFIQASKRTDVLLIRDEIIETFETNIGTALIRKYMVKEVENPKEEVERIKQMRDPPAEEWSDVDELDLD